MPRMIPAEIPHDATGSEGAVFEAMKQQLPKSWIVIFGKRFNIPSEQGRRAKEGEVDFIVLDPSRGYVGIEVKGGGVNRDRDGWFRLESGTKIRIGDPGRQAQSGIHAIAGFVDQQPTFQRLGRGPRYGWGVCLPYLDVTGSLGPELPEEFVIDQHDMHDLVGAMDRLFAANGCDTPLIKGTQGAWLHALVPAFNLATSVSYRATDVDAQIFRMTDEQKNLLDTFAEVSRVGVKGAAGTGKTVLALEQARRWTDDGLRVLFLCYNRPLADEIAANVEVFTVETFHKLCSSKARSAGLEFKSPKDSAGDRRFWEEQAPEILSKALDIYPDDRFDAVVVDEGQDFLEFWWIAVEKLLRDEKNGHLWVFFDPNQDLYGGGPIEALGLTPARLTYNCRNTEKIARYSADRISIDVKLRTGAPPGLEISERRCQDASAMVESVRKTIHQYTAQLQLSSHDIVILSSLGAQSPVWKAKKLGNYDLVELGTKPGPNEIRFSTLQRFKGLEAKAIILCDVDERAPLCAPNHLYVGTSRARQVLTVLKYE